MRYPKLILGLLIIAAVDGKAQSAVNPDISVITRFAVESSDGASLPARRSFSTPTFALDEIEIAVQGYLNPYARADVFLAKPGTGTEPLEIEEASATILRGLPLDLNLRMGKYLLEFGRINTQHPHTWSFATRPLSSERFLGEEGAGASGISASLLLPTGDLYTRVNVDLFDSGSLIKIDPQSGESAGAPGLADTTGGTTRLGLSSRLTTFFPVSEWSDLEVGLSAMRAVHDPYANLSFWYTNVDFKYKWKPDAYTSLTLLGEGLVNQRSVATASGTRDVRSLGGYLSADYQFKKIFTVGTRIDRSASPYGSDDLAWGGALWFGFYPVEETLAFRLHWQHIVTESPTAPRTGVNTILLQVMFSLGPHRVHPF